MTAITLETMLYKINTMIKKCHKWPHVGLTDQDANTLLNLSVPLSSHFKICTLAPYSKY